VNEIVTLYSLARRSLAITLKQLRKNETDIICKRKGVIEKLQGNVPSESKRRIADHNVLAIWVGWTPREIVLFEDARMPRLNVKCNACVRENL
jgi:hypothetical protein